MKQPKSLKFGELQPH
jgi:SNF2 family DNA or RNA helicase